jgi:hypothetical protein
MRWVTINHRLERLREVLIPVFQPGRQKITDGMIVRGAYVHSQGDETLVLTRVVRTLKKMTQRFIRQFTARAQTQKFVLYRGLTIPPFAQRKLIVDQFHMSHLSQGSQFSKVLAKDFEVNLLPNLIRPVIRFLLYMFGRRICNTVQQYVSR